MLRRRQGSHMLPALVLAVVGGVVISCGVQEHSGGGGAKPEKISFTQAPIQNGYADSTDTGVVGILIENLGSCTGSLIAPNVVLTARHCVGPTSSGGGGVSCSDTFGTPYAASQFYVYNDQTYTGSTYLYTVSEVRVPTATTHCGNDIAILILNQNFSATKAKVVEPAIDYPPTGGLPFSAAGYGITCPTCTDSESRRRKDSLSVLCVGPSQCGVPASYMSGQEWVGGDAVCSGDSGGPALDAQGRVIGVASRAAQQNGQCISPVYERVDTWKSMIVQAALDGAAQGGYTPPAWTGGGTGGSGGGTQTCDVCVNQSTVPGYPCETAYNNCVNAKECTDYAACAKACGTDYKCAATCYNQNLNGAHLYDAISKCYCTQGCPIPCATECAPQPCGGWNLASWGTGCDTCFSGKCCAEGQACTDSQDCYDLTKCQNVCTTQACINACASGHPTGSAVWNTWMLCLENKCPGECGFGTGGSGGAAGSGGSGVGGTGVGGSGVGGTGVGGDAGTGGVAGAGGATAGAGGASAGAAGAGATGLGGTSQAGAGGSTAKGGASQGGAGGEPTQDDAGDQNPAAPAASDSGCGCATPGSTPANSGWLLLVAAIAAAGRRKNSKRSR